MIYRDACLSDTEDIKELLDNYDLPSIDIEEHLLSFVVAESNGKIIGLVDSSDVKNLACFAHSQLALTKQDGGLLIISSTWSGKKP